MINYEQRGDVITFTAGADVAAGKVVRVGALLGVTAAAVANGATGEACIVGVFNVPKVSGAVIAQGERLVWDASAAAFDDSAATPATGDVSGEAAVAWEAAGNGVTEIAVRFTGVPGTVA